MLSVTTVSRKTTGTCPDPRRRPVGHNRPWWPRGSSCPAVPCVLTRSTWCVQWEIQELLQNACEFISCSGINRLVLVCFESLLHREAKRLMAGEVTKFVFFQCGFLHFTIETYSHAAEGNVTQFLSRLPRRNRMFFSNR